MDLSRSWFIMSILDDFGLAKLILFDLVFSCLIFVGLGCPWLTIDELGAIYQFGRKPP